MGTREVFASIAAFFEKEHIDYAVIGAFALYGYGYVRATRDIDILTRLDRQPGTIRFLESLGFETIHSSVAFSNHVHPIGPARVDIMYVEGATAREMFGAVRRVLVLRDMELPVVSPEHLIALKLFAASNNPDRKYRDLGDIKEIVTSVEVDKGAVRKYFSKFDMARYADEILGPRGMNG